MSYVVENLMTEHVPGPVRHYRIVDGIQVLVSEKSMKEIIGERESTPSGGWRGRGKRLNPKAVGKEIMRALAKMEKE